MTYEEVCVQQALRRLRMQAGLSARELGERADVTASAIHAIERGIRRKVTIQTARKLADALGEALNREASEVMWELTEA